METPEAAIKITDVAAGKLTELLASQEEADQVLRVAVRGGGCSGFQYALALDKRNDFDFGFEDRQWGAQLVAGGADELAFLLGGGAEAREHVIERFAESMQFVFGSEVDFVEGLQGAGFAVNNPNVVAACGCGSSFQVREDAAERATAGA